MNCPECDSDISITHHENGDMILCSNCGCEMELLNKDPFEIRVVEEEK